MKAMRDFMLERYKRVCPFNSIINQDYYIVSFTVGPVEWLGILQFQYRFYCIAIVITK